MNWYISGKDGLQGKHRVASVLRQAEALGEEVSFLACQAVPLSRTVIVFINIEQKMPLVFTVGN